MRGSTTAARVGSRAGARTEPRDRLAFRKATRRALAIGVGICAVVTLANLSYYFGGPAVRLRSSVHAFLKPSGWIGQSAGIAAFLLFAFLWLYPLRKRVRALAFTGSLARWLDVHIVAGLLVPLLGAVHAGWRFQGIIGLGYFSMLAVSLSGIVGRYLYVHLPRGREGIELSIEEIDRRADALVEGIAQAVGATVPEVRSLLDRDRGSARAHGGILGTLVDLLLGDIARWRLARRLRSRWAHRPGLDALSIDLAVRLVRRREALVQQAKMLEATRRLFRYWHVAHLPIAITGLVAVCVHVVAVVALGVTWFY